MRIFNEDKTEELFDIDETLGYLKLDKLFITHHEATPEIKEEFHYEVITTYANGGVDGKKVIDVPYQAAKEAWDEYEDIMIFIPYSQKILNENKINELLEKLRDYDYIGIKIATGRGTVEEYASQIEEMNQWASEIDRLREENKLLSD